MDKKDLKIGMINRITPGMVGNHRLLKDLGNVNPAFAKHTMIKNDVVKLFALERFGTIDLLDQPMCTKCEKPCTWHEGGTAYHVECGTTIKNPVTMLEYLREQIKLPEWMVDLLGSSFYDPNEIILEGGLAKKIEEDDR